MSDKYYNVVFENTTQMGGYAFVRTIVEYANEERFKNVAPSPLQNVIAQGISDDEAQNLCHLTPIVVYYTAAIEETFENGIPNWNLIHYYLQNADDIARGSLALRRREMLTYSPPKGLKQHLMSLAGQDTDKSLLMGTIWKSYNFEKDTLDHLLLDAYLNRALHQINQRK